MVTVHIAVFHLVIIFRSHNVAQCNYCAILQPTKKLSLNATIHINLKKYKKKLIQVLVEMEKEEDNTQEATCLVVSLHASTICTGFFAVVDVEKEEKRVKKTSECNAKEDEQLEQMFIHSGVVCVEACY